MIDRRELLEKARQKGMNLMMVEKDYVLGWLLFGFAKNEKLVFKGGTALSKIYFPRIWRLSEGLDFSLIEGELKDLPDSAEAIFENIREMSGIEFALKSTHINPDYLRMKLQYKGAIGRNWIKVDVMKNDLVEKPVLKSVPREYSDYMYFRVKVESLEEILCAKLRTVIERKKCRDYFDLWKLTQMDFDRRKIKQVFAEKCAVKGIEFRELRQIFPSDLEMTLKSYWERELGRLVNPLPDMTNVLNTLKEALKFL